MNSLHRKSLLQKSGIEYYFFVANFMQAIVIKVT